MVSNKGKLVLTVIIASALLWQCGARIANAQKISSKVQFINHVMRDVVFPLNNPETPDVIPVGYDMELPNEQVHDVEPGESFWVATEDLIATHNLYRKWQAQGRPTVPPFVYSALSPESTADTDSLIAVQDSLKGVINSLQARLDEAQQTQAEDESGSFWLWAFAILFATGFLVTSFVAWYYSQKHRELERVYSKTEEKLAAYEVLGSVEEFAALKAYANENLIGIDLREFSFVRHVDGRDFYYLRKGKSDGSDGRWVLTPTGYRFKFENLKEKLDESIEEFPGLEKVVHKT